MWTQVIFAAVVAAGTVAAQGVPQQPMSGSQEGATEAAPATSGSAAGQTPPTPAENPTASSPRVAQASVAEHGRQAAGGAVEESARFHARHPRYRVEASDILELTFAFAQEFNQMVTVQPDGFISLREAGDIHVLGKTVEETTAVVKSAYAKILRDPQVSATLKDFTKPSFIASGEVKNPGRYELRGQTTVIQAVAVAGGFTEQAKHSQVLLMRRITPDEVEVKKLNLKKMLADGNFSEDLYLRPGDMLFVPQNMLSKLKGFILPRVSPTLRPF